MTARAIRPKRKPKSRKLLARHKIIPSPTSKAIPPGVLARHRSRPDHPPHVPDLIGVKDRRYLDASGLVQNRERGFRLGVDRFGQSADIPDLYAVHGLDPLAIVDAAARAMVARLSRSVIVNSGTAR